LKDLQLLEKKEAEMISKLQEFSRNNEQMAHKLTEQQVKLA
jgi:hypothetical protein